MTEGPEAKDAPGHDALSGLGEQERRALLDWVGEHLPQVRRTVDERRIPRWILTLSFAVGLVAHVGGYLVKRRQPKEALDGDEAAQRDQTRTASD
jgi:hypothetical protein